MRREDIRRYTNAHITVQYGGLPHQKQVGGLVWVPKAWHQIRSKATNLTNIQYQLPLVRKLK